MRTTPILALAFTLGALGCEHDPAELEPGDPVGSYALVAADDGPLPHSFRTDDVWLEITRGAVELDADGRFTETLTLVATDPDGVRHEDTVETTGTWLSDDGAFEMAADPDGELHGEGTAIQGSLNYRLADRLLLDLAFQRQE